MIDVTGCVGRTARLAFWHAALWLALAFAPMAARAAPSAAVVMDARTGEILIAQNADARLHPASLTKMMTLYVAFEAIRRGEISLDTMVTVSAKAAAEPPSRLGLRAGQRISMRNLIRAAAIKSANDAATAIGEAISGSEAAFARRMTETARAIGMRNSTFRNAHGLTADGHLSTARDMTILGRRLFTDFPQYYSLFSRVTVDAGVAQVSNTNRRFLESYRGADGIKTGYTRAAGFNLTASAERGNKRLVATVLGGTSTAQRNARMAELLDAGFRLAPANAATRRPPQVTLPGSETAPPPPVAEVTQPRTASAKTIRLVTAPARSPRPPRRPDAAAPVLVAEAPAQPAQRPAEPAEPAPAAALPFALITETPDAVADAIEGELRDALAAGGAAAPRPRPSDLSSAAAAAEEAEAEPIAEPGAAAVEIAASVPPGPSEAPVGPPPSRPVALAADTVLTDPATDAPATADAAAEAAIETAADEVPSPEGHILVADAALPDAPSEQAGAATGEPAAEVAEAAMPDLIARDYDERDDPDSLPAEVIPEPSGIILTAEGSDLPPVVAVGTAATFGDGPVTLTLSTSGARHWGITLGRFPSRGTAERALLMTGLSEPAMLGSALRKVVPRGGGFEATFAGLTPEEAELACRRLVARDVACTPIGP
jgi:D-alanyl-D-alanine carboxypeptidase